MLNKHYFELDKVDSITLTLERETEWGWFSEIPASPRIFLGIKLGTKPAIPAGWSEWEDGHEPKPSEYFEPYSWYRVDEDKKKIYNKARVEITFGYKQSISTQFESNEEAQEWVDELIATSDKHFHVIINR